MPKWVSGVQEIILATNINSRSGEKGSLGAISQATNIKSSSRIFFNSLLRVTPSNLRVPVRRGESASPSVKISVHPWNPRNYPPDFARLTLLINQMPEMINAIPAICQTLIVSPSSTPQMTATMGIRYVVVEAKTGEVS